MRNCLPLSLAGFIAIAITGTALAKTVVGGNGPDRLTGTGGRT